MRGDRRLLRLDARLRRGVRRRRRLRLDRLASTAGAADFDSATGVAARRRCRTTSSPAARRSAIAFDAGQVGVMRRFAAQRGVQLRQRVEGLVDQRDHRRAGRTRAVEHAVEHVLDLPAELAQGLGADQAAAALERVEHAADRTQLLGVVRRVAPRRQQFVEVADLFLEFLEEDFADLVVDVVAGRFETAGGAAGDRAPARALALGDRRGVGSAPRRRVGRRRRRRLRSARECRRRRCRRRRSVGAVVSTTAQRRRVRPRGAVSPATASSAAIPGSGARCRGCRRGSGAGRAAPRGSTPGWPAHRPACRAAGRWARACGRAVRSRCSGGSPTR